MNNLLFIDNLTTNNLVTNNDTSIGRLTNWHIALESTLHPWKFKTPVLPGILN